MSFYRGLYQISRNLSGNFNGSRFGSLHFLASHEHHLSIGSAAKGPFVILYKQGFSEGLRGVGTSIPVPVYSWGGFPFPREFSGSLGVKIGQIRRASPFIRLNGRVFVSEPRPFKIRA
ncbi:hypothetical protein PIB30_018142 [Stylosanthes scabra]|uniref:Uncharacterized protein n=1 Tax=Stylosanthes scabra TaxID=79078 RepID=A0ABU6Q7T3_9FABA|nr:hypothetical protein [Stylosanthes scabra]